MKRLSKPNLHVALIHFPVISRTGEIIASAVTNLDLHDIARASRTYGLRSFYIVTPVQDQIELVDKIVSHWVSGSGAVYNPIRGEALSLIRARKSFQEVFDEISAEGLGEPKIVATSAKHRSSALSTIALKELIEGDQPYILTFGTAWGLTEGFLNDADYILEPIDGGMDYNHLSVRSAVAIILDRLLGK